MSDFWAIAGTLESQGASTGAYNAILALDISQLNLSIAAAYAGGAPGTPTSLTAAVTVPEDGWSFLVTVGLGPPLMTFGSETGDPAVSFSMFLTEGVVANANPQTGMLRYAIGMAPCTSSVSGSAVLGVVQGSDSNDQITLDFGTATNWTANIDSVANGSVVQSQISDALNAYYADTSYGYTLGTFAVTDAASPYLTPTSFTLSTAPQQSAPTALLVQMNTADTLPAAGAQPPYLIPDGYTAAILVSGYSTANVVAEAIAASCKPTGFNISGPWSSAVFSTTAAPDGPWPVTWSGGTLDLGPIGGGNAPWWVCSVDNDSQTTPQNIALSPPAMSLAVSPSLSLTFNQTWSQSWYLYWPEEAYTSNYTGWYQTTMTAAYSSSVAITLANDLVTLDAAWTGSVTSSSVNAPGVAELVQANCTGQMQDALGNSLSQISLGDLNTYLLDNIATPNGAVGMGIGALPYDLYLAGMINQGVGIIPPIQSVTTSNGAGVCSFSILSLSDTTWSVSPPSAGTVNPTTTSPNSTWYDTSPAQTTTFTPNSDLNGSTGLAVIVANTNGQQGYAIAQINGNSALTISPMQLSLCWGDGLQPYTFQVLCNGQPVDADVTLLSSAGTVTASGSNSYTYTGPADLSASQQIEIQATYGFQTATTTQWWLLAQDPTLSTTPATSPAITVAPDGTQSFSVSSVFANQFYWTISLGPDQSNTLPIGSIAVATSSQSAVYTAPGLPTGVTSITVWVTVYSVDTCWSLANWTITVESS